MPRSTPAATTQIWRPRTVALANSPQLVNMSDAIGDGDEIVDLTQGISVFVASDLCLLGYERSESLSLRHDATGFRRDETSGDRRCHP
jgi:hypothetical protein